MPREPILNLDDANNALGAVDVELATATTEVTRLTGETVRLQGLLDASTTEVARVTPLLATAQAEVTRITPLLATEKKRATDALAKAGVREAAAAHDDETKPKLKGLALLTESMKSRQPGQKTTV